MSPTLLLLLRIALFAGGVTIVFGTFLSAVRTFVMPRSSDERLTNTVFRVVLLIFRLRLRRVTTYEQRDQMLALYAPISLLMLPAVWLTVILFGYGLMYWAVEPRPLYDVFSLSGSSLLTLGFTKSEGVLSLILEFTEAIFGLTMAALLIAYLPTMYSAFSRREAMVAMLDVRAGTPPTTLELISRAHRIRGLDSLTELWVSWMEWFVEVEESHTSLAALVFFRSPQPNASWITAAGSILDAAAFMEAAVDIRNDPQAQLMIRAGYLALRRIADTFHVDYDPEPQPDDVISIAQHEFDSLYDQLAANGVPLKPDREQAWLDYRGWRVNYDRVLLALAALTMAPYAPWVSDRSLPRGTMFRRRGQRAGNGNGRH